MIMHSQPMLIHLDRPVYHPSGGFLSPPEDPLSRGPSQGERNCYQPEELPQRHLNNTRARFRHSGRVAFISPHLLTFDGNNGSRRLLLLGWKKIISKVDFF